VALGIRLDQIDPGRPDQNGAHERIHRDIRAELQLTPVDGVEASQALLESKSGGTPSPGGMPPGAGF